MSMLDPITFAEDVRDLDDTQLGALRQVVLAEQERRAKLAQLPEQLAGMARDAAVAGCDRDELLERVTDALTTDQETTP